MTVLSRYSLALIKRSHFRCMAKLITYVNTLEMNDKETRHTLSRLDREALFFLLERFPVLFRRHRNLKYFGLHSNKKVQLSKSRPVSKTHGTTHEQGFIKARENSLSSP